jgi:hypothetical protein
MEHEMSKAELTEMEKELEKGLLDLDDSLLDAVRDLNAVDENEVLRAVVREVQELRDSGYDGPFMGERIEILMARLRSWELFANQKEN